MGNIAEGTAAQFGITREEQDDYAIQSYARAKMAHESGYFKVVLFFFGGGRGWEGDGKGMGRGWEGDGKGMGRGWEGDGKGMGRGLLDLFLNRIKSHFFLYFYLTYQTPKG